LFRFCCFVCVVSFGESAHCAVTVARFAAAMAAQCHGVVNTVLAVRTGFCASGRAKRFDTVPMQCGATEDGGRNPPQPTSPVVSNLNLKPGPTGPRWRSVSHAAGMAPHHGLALSARHVCEVWRSHFAQKRPIGFVVERRFRGRPTRPSNGGAFAQVVRRHGEEVRRSSRARRPGASMAWHAAPGTKLVWDFSFRMRAPPRTGPSREDRNPDGRPSHGRRGQQPQKCRRVTCERPRMRRLAGLQCEASAPTVKVSQRVGESAAVGVLFPHFKAERTVGPHTDFCHPWQNDHN